MTNARMIDRWFPVVAVDEACKTREGSGQNEKAIFTWFASRPIAQARAAVLTALLPDDASLYKKVTNAVLSGDGDLLAELGTLIRSDGRQLTVLDCFSGRGIIPLEAARLGLRAEGIDLSPVATLAGRLLADWPFRDWNNEPPLPPLVSSQEDARSNEAGNKSDEPEDEEVGLFLESSVDRARPRLIIDLKAVFAEIGRRVEERVAAWFPKNADGSYPWGYLWATTIPCDACKRRFPLIGSYVLRNPYRKTDDPGQWFWVNADNATGQWTVVIEEGVPTKPPTFAAPEGRQGKSARCSFCGHVHNLAAVKSKGFAGQYKDTPLLASDLSNVTVPATKGGRRQVERKVFRNLRSDEVDCAQATKAEDGPMFGTIPALPTEKVAPGNASSIDATGYGYKTFADLMCRRQALHFVETARAIRSVHDDLLASGMSADYAAVLVSYAASNLCRRVRRATRGARLEARGKSDGSLQNRNYVGDIFTNESGISFGFDFFETGPGAGPGTWASTTKTTLKPLESHLLHRNPGIVPARLRRASATALPYRDASIDLVVTDPPYYEMINYADVSDVFYVWLRRCLFDIVPDLFAIPGDSMGLQDKSEEIIVKQGNAAGDHRTPAWYETQLSKAFDEMRRVLKPGGHLVVVFGHSDPDAWRRLLGALQRAGFVVTSAWPSRTESGNTGVASIRVTVTIGCRVAPPKRPVGMAAVVDREVMDAVMERVRQWDADGLALEDQLMASYGPAMEVYGRYMRVINLDGSDTNLDRFLTIARRAVRDAMRLRVDELPLETFDAVTRFSVFWLRAKGRTEVPKGEARFFAQADELRLVDLRDQILAESKAGFRLRLDDPGPVTSMSSVFEVVRAMAHAWDEGGTEAVAEVISRAGRGANDQHLWAVVGDLTTYLPASDQTAKALAAIRRMSSRIALLVRSAPQVHVQGGLFAGQEE
jgi:adenine-specific DNA methylase